METVDAANTLDVSKILQKATPAISHRQRRLGYRKTAFAEAAPAMLFEKCHSIHTFGMKFDLEVICLDRDYNVLDRRIMKPRRLMFGPKGTWAILEIPRA